MDNIFNTENLYLPNKIKKRQFGRDYIIYQKKKPKTFHVFGFFTLLILLHFDAIFRTVSSFCRLFECFKMTTLLKQTDCSKVKEEVCNSARKMSKRTEVTFAEFLCCAVVFLKI